MNDQEKVRVLVGLLKAGSNVVNVSDLLDKLGTPRRARRAIFMARKAGIFLSAVRQGGRGVVAYTLLPVQGAVSFDEALAKLEPKRKPKVQKQKVAKTKKAKAKKVAPVEVEASEEEVLGEVE